jgi:hypothetical protein
MFIIIIFFRTESNIEHSDGLSECDIEGDEQDWNNETVHSHGVEYAENEQQNTGNQTKKLKKKSVDFETRLLTMLEERKEEVHCPEKLFLLSLLPKIKILIENQKTQLYIDILNSIKNIQSQNGSFSISHTTHNDTVNYHESANFNPRPIVNNIINSRYAAPNSTRSPNENMFTPITTIHNYPELNLHPQSSSTITNHILLNYFYSAE